MKMKTQKALQEFVHETALAIAKIQNSNDCDWNKVLNKASLLIVALDDETISPDEPAGATKESE